MGKKKFTPDKSHAYTVHFFYQLQDWASNIDLELELNRNKQFELIDFGKIVFSTQDLFELRIFLQAWKQAKQSGV